MPKPSARDLRLLLADPDGARRRRILSGVRGVTVIEAASISEAFDLAESQEPNAIAMAAELSGDIGLHMFLRLADALSAAFVLFGDPARNRTPRALGKAVGFVEFGPESDVELILDAFLSTSGPAPGGARSPMAISDDGHPGGPPPALIVIGASTGGVSAIETVLTDFPRDCPPTLVVQHIRAGFIEGMIARLDARCAPRIAAAQDGQALRRGEVLVAADSDRHLVLQGKDAPRIRLLEGAPRHGHRPSVDALFESVAPLGRVVSAALLTGMGADGADGMGKIRAAGGATIAQDEASCVVYGMPRVAVEAGAASRVLPLGRIAGALLGAGSARHAPVNDSKEFAR